MKQIILIAIVGLMFSCSKNKIKYEKPFIIFYTYPSSGNAHVVGICHYEAQDKNGNILSFYDADYKYSVGDTLK